MKLTLLILAGLVLSEAAFAGEGGTASWYVRLNPSNPNELQIKVSSRNVSGGGYVSRASCVVRFFGSGSQNLGERTYRCKVPLPEERSKLTTLPSLKNAVSIKGVKMDYTLSPVGEKADDFRPEPPPEKGTAAPSPWR